MGNYCWLAVVVSCAVIWELMSFQSFLLCHLVIATNATSRNCRFIQTLLFKLSYILFGRYGSLVVMLQDQPIRCLLGKEHVD